MNCPKVEEMLELLQAEWSSHQDLSLMQFLGKIAKEAGCNAPLAEISDDILIYQLKMRSQSVQSMIPGLAMEYVPDFKDALLRARGVIK
jgi:uncharacterized protein YihD (DUF1040 family)